MITGADRIAANGDTANKIGTYALAVLARHHGIPLYVVAPTHDARPHRARRSRDPDRRARSGVRSRRGSQRTTPPSTSRPPRSIAAIVTENGAHRAPYAHSLAEAVAAA